VTVLAQSSNIVVSFVSALLALSGALGIAYAIFRSATVTKTMELYKLENEALGKSVSRLQADQAVQSERITVLENENRVLRDVVTGKTAIEHLTGEVLRTEAQRREEHAAMMVLLRDLLGQIKDMWAQLGTRARGRKPGTGEIGRATDG
jgi:hypothetical protein